VNTNEIGNPKKHWAAQELLTNFYRCTIESVLAYSCTVWFSSCTTEEKTDLKRGK